ncbi:LuxR C-terminal-related transcriptional regulator [Rhodococcus ruber]|uniref:LuxR C-terminal-related transcriptional regulator n=1 Tax=Rhodococcus ruber TaxID=1830 RepID=UPI003CCAFE19
MTGSPRAALQIRVSSPRFFPRRWHGPWTRWTSSSGREHDVLECPVAGSSNREIGQKLNIAESAGCLHVGHILRKLRAYTGRSHRAGVDAAATRPAEFQTHSPARSPAGSPCQPDR